MEESIINVSRNPELIAAEINNIKEQTKRQVLYNSIEIGRRLTEAKMLLPHGDWGKWLEEKVDYQKSTANNLMKIFKEYGSDQLTLLGDNAKSQALGNLSYTQAIALLGIHDTNARDEFIEKNNIDDMSTRELKKVIEELNQAKKEKEELKKTVQISTNSNLSLKEKIKELEKISNEALSTLKEKENETLEAIKETEEYKSKVKELQERPIEVISGVDEAEVKKLEEQHQKEIGELNNKIKESQAKLKELESRPTEIIKEVDESKIEVLQDQHKKEIETLMSKIEASKNRVQDLELKLNDTNKNNTDENLVKFKVHFDGIVENFKTLLSDVAEIDEGNQEKYKVAVKGLLSKMLESI